MSIKVGEVSKVLRVNAGYDLSSYTALALGITKPDGTIVNKTQAAGEVTLGVIDVTETINGISTTLTANEYVNYPIESGVFDSKGEYLVELTYTSGSTVLIGTTARIMIGC